MIMDLNKQVSNPSSFYTLHTTVHPLHLMLHIYWCKYVNNKKKKPCSNFREINGVMWWSTYLQVSKWNQVIHKLFDFDSFHFHPPVIHFISF